MARLFSSDYLNALADGNQSNVAGLTANWYRTASPETRLVLDMVDPVVKTIVKELNSLTIKEKAHLIGRVNGLVTFEVLLSVATSGAGTAIKAGKVSEFLYDMSKFKFVTKYDNTGKITATLQKFADRLAVVLNTRVCFVAGTLVSTAEGFKPIEELKVGDLVLTRNEFADGEETDNDYQPVTELITTHPSELLKLTLSDGNSEETLTTTANHPFYSLDTKSFIHADQLDESSRVASADGQPLTVTAISRRAASEGETFTTYNIEVAGSHTYFVGRQRAWVHNTSTPCKVAMKRFTDVLDELGESADKTKAAEEMLDLLRSMEKSGDIPSGSVPQHFNDALRELANPGPPITPRLTADEVAKYSKLEPEDLASPIVPGGGLRAHEGIRSVFGRFTHTISRHIGKTASELRARGIRQASSFLNRAEAENFISQAIAVERRNIDDFMRQPLSSSPAGNRWVKDVPLNADIGIIVTRGASEVTKGRGVRLVIDKVRNAAGQDWTVVTAFPIP